mgnify:CR=1 FL=1
MDYNALYNKKHGHMILVGLRYAATSFKYDVEALGINDLNTGEVWVIRIYETAFGETACLLIIKE